MSTNEQNLTSDQCTLNPCTIMHEWSFGIGFYCICTPLLELEGSSVAVATQAYPAQRLSLRPLLCWVAFNESVVKCLRVFQSSIVVPAIA